MKSYTMTIRILSIILFLLSFSLARAAESQIILVQSEAYLVTLDENYDVLEIIERVPDYFQNHSTHEEILADHVRHNRSEVYGCHDAYLIKENSSHSSIASCSWTTSNQIESGHLSVQSHFSINRIDPRFRSKAA